MNKHGIPKSHALDLIQTLVVETLADAYDALRECDPSIVRKDDFDLDSAYIKRRFESEGVAFLTKSLPRLGDWLDQYVWGVTSLQRVEGFKPYNGLYPQFLRPFWIYLERLHSTECSATQCSLYKILRTLLHGLKKLDVPCDPADAAAKIDSFIGIEEELLSFNTPQDPSVFRAQLLMEDYLRHYNVSCDHPKHGPGAVAGGERHNEKWCFSTLYASVHAEFPYWDYIYPVRSALPRSVSGFSRRTWPLQLAANGNAYRALKREPAPTAKLLLVPKDSRGPRVISCEPKELMYLQQGVSRSLMSFIENHPYTRGHVNFQDQTVNGRLALEGSHSRELDTIDLSDASDRVSVELVTYLFPRHVSRKLLALRSTATLLPDGRKIPLAKFAPMGSALCFPVESLVFWALAVGTILNSTNDLRLSLASVYVYGDDIIIANGFTEQVIKTLERCCLKVNVQKSFMGAHPFRESCGVDAFKGHDVTISRVKNLPPQRSCDGAAIIAWLKYAENDQYTMPRRSCYMLDVVERYTGPIPRVPFPQAFLSIVTRDGHWSREDYNAKWDGDSCYWVAKLLRAKNRKVESPIPGWARLQRNLVQGVLEGSPTQVVDKASTQISKRNCKITYLGA